MNSLSERDDLPCVIIESERGVSDGWRELWRYRDLLCFLAWRDILLRYKQTVIGVAWALLPSLATVGIFSLIFGRIGHFPSQGIPYPVLVMAGTVPWNLFSNALSQGGNSVVANGSLVSKVYFPRLLIPLSALLVSLVDFSISLGALALLMIGYRVIPNWHLVTLPLFLLFTLITGFGVGVWLAALNVRYRDFRYVIPLLVQFGLYVSPVGFSEQVVPERWRLLYSLNPMAGAINGFRWSLLGQNTPLHMNELLVSAALMVFILVTGLWYFRKVERTFADVI